jgi:hypothetical protein
MEAPKMLWRWQTMVILSHGWHMCLNNAYVTIGTRIMGEDNEDKLVIVMTCA